jgi:uncharacterized membrane protein YfcA
LQPGIEDIVLLVLLFIMAFLYASVGQAGATGYLAAMGLLGVSPEIMRPSALILNILVASIGTYKYFKVRRFPGKFFLLLAITSIPFAYLGGTVNIPAQVYNIVVGTFLVLVAWRLWQFSASETVGEIRTPSFRILAVVSAALGFMSGVTGIGGGVLLAPMLIFLRWVPVSSVPGISAAYILINSIAGLAGVAFSTSLIGVLDLQLPLWAAAVVVGGYFGAEYGIRNMSARSMRVVLAALLFLAGIKMIATV